jgi:hypothetical protein
MLAQRFPEDFDGIIAGAPVLDFTSTMAQFATIARALAEGPLTLAHVKLLGESIYGQCDALDGLADGLITDPRICRFSPRRDLKRCTEGAGPDCFTSAQIAAIEKIQAPVAGPRGPLIAGFPVGAEALGANGKPGWAEWIVKEDGPTLGFQFADSFFRYMAWPSPRPDQTLAGLDLKEAVEGYSWLEPLLDAKNPDLSAFRERGGKLILYYGLADPALNPHMAIDYFEAVRAKMGGDVSDFLHFFTMPGVFHCGGGPGCGSVDFLGALRGWVERNEAPTGLRAAQVVEGKTLRTRPLCSWPSVARYRGTGDPNEAGSFVCGPPLI